MNITGLREMQVNQSGTIESIEANGLIGRRLREMGLLPGTLITVLGRAPLKDPVSIRVLDTTLTLRNNEADVIRVRLI